MNLSRDGMTLRVNLDAPERKNTLTSADCVALSSAVHDAEARVVLLSASGPYFCAGLEPGADPGELFNEWNGPPVVAAVQGPAIDDGVALMACAHIVVAAQGSSFALTANRSGAFPARAFETLSRAIGRRRALELALTGRVFTAQDALSWGLVHYLAPAFEFDDRAEAIAAALASNRLWLRDVL